MVQESAPQTAQLDEEPGKRPPLRSRLWARTGLGDKTLWDLLQLLIVPLALAAIGFWFTAQQEARQREIEDRRARVEREIEAERAEQVTLQAYLDQMGTLLLDRNLRAADENSDVRRLARARTLVVLDALGPTRQERVLRFLHEAEMIRATSPEGQPVIPLKYASLESIELPHRILLRGADLQQADLSGANLAYIDLRDTYLAGAHFEGADLEGAHLEGADLSGTFLEGADLSDANLADVDLSNAEELWKPGTDMRERGAGLAHADLSGANLIGADLSGADLKGANVTDEQLAECASLEGAIMPDGTKYP
jgi:Pentapeptide repeats (8 copies)